jgi:hypothetical protein
MQGMNYMHVANYSAQLHSHILRFDPPRKHYSIERGRVFNYYAREARPELHTILDMIIQQKNDFSAVKLKVLQHLSVDVGVKPHSEFSIGGTSSFLSFQLACFSVKVRDQVEFVYFCYHKPLQN